MACEIAKLHDADLTMLHVIEVPASVPFSAPLPYRVTIGESLLQKAEAIARDLDVTANLEIISSRGVIESIVQFLKEKNYDLLILGTISSKTGGRFGSRTEKIVKAAPCRVWICTESK